MSSLELGALAKAITQLEKGVILKQDNPDNELMRDGVIQRFEYTIDLAWKLLQRYLKHDLQVDDYTIRSKKDLFREAARLRVIEDAERWIVHYEARNSTSHNYNQEVANLVYKQALLFLPDAKQLFSELKK